MNSKDEAFFKRLLATFKLEAEEHVKNMSSDLIEMENASDSEKILQFIEVAYREAHSLKGAARAVNITEIENLCQSLESTFSALKRQEIALSTEGIDVLHLAVDNLKKLIPAVDRERTLQEKNNVSNTVKLLEDTLKGIFPDTEKADPPETKPKETAIAEEPAIPEAMLKETAVAEEPATPEAKPKETAVAEEPATPEAKPKETAVAEEPATPEAKPKETAVAEEPATSETVRIATSKLESILLESEELLAAKLAAELLADELQKLGNYLIDWEAQWAKVSSDVRILRHSLNTDGKYNPHETRLLEFIDLNYNNIKSIEEKLGELERIARRDLHNLSGISDNLLDDTKKVLMFPFSSVVEALPKYVRDLSKEQSKNIKLVINGDNIEIDRRILNEIKDPLMHMIRNCIDHGIEKPEERKNKGKPTQGIITISISQKTGNSVELIVSDDGAGINVAGLRKTAVKNGIISREKADKMSDKETLSLLGRSGISTSPIITDISGRGLGMAIVTEKIEKVHGRISIDTLPDKGTTFTITLPLTVAIFRGVIVRIEEKLFALPTSNVERVLRIKKENIKTIENRKTVKVNEQILPLVNINEVLELPAEESEESISDYLSVLVLTYAGKKLAFKVDEIVNEQEMLVKNLGAQLSRVRNILGISIMATGKMVPVINIGDLIQSAMKITPSKVVSKGKTITKKQAVMVVEDSITSRMLVKNILEAAGYNVKTAVDGIDAFSTLKVEEFDLVVSDVDMPRMNGFDLTAKIRADKKMSELPVILITALGSREHRERGIEVGANAYIVKSDFDQSNLLEIVHKLI